MSEWSVPGYTGLKVLGSGGFGDVMLARHDASGVLVAIKYLKGDLLADPEFVALFRGEAAVLASLQDRNIVRLYEYVESPRGAAIVMELVDGVSLQAILASQGGTTPEAALVVLQGSLLGLAAAHQRGVVHRDYKPANVLVNGDGVSKLTDFGIAARSGDRPVAAGTYWYAAPEQMAGGPAHPVGDVYAATVTFYECVTGRPPFVGDLSQLIRQHRTAAVPLEPVPAPLRPLIAAGMAKDPRQRPVDADTFVTQLRAIAFGAYGEGWERRGRSHLAEAALLLVALWPSAKAPAVQGAATEVVQLTPPPPNARNSQNTQNSQDSRESLHRRHLWHVRHLLHLMHLRNLRRRSAQVAVATCAVVAVGFGAAFAAHAFSEHHGQGSPEDPSSSSSSSSSTKPTLTATQTVTFTSKPPVDAVVGGVYHVAANGGASGNPVVFSIDPSPACTVSKANGTGGRFEATVTFVRPGTCVVAATQKGSAKFQDARMVKQTFAVNAPTAHVTQTLTFTSAPPANAIVGDSYQVGAHGGASGNPVSFSIDSSSTPKACSVSGAVVRFTGAGLCEIDANQAGNGKFLTARQAEQTVTVHPLPAQAITFTSQPPNPAYVGSTYTVAATGGGSGNPVTFTADSASAGVCSVNGAVVTFTRVGSCVIDANQAGNAQHQAAGQAQQTVEINARTAHLAQKITVTSQPPSPGFVGGTYTVAATGGGSGNPVTFTADSASAGVCSVDGAVVTFTGAGNCVIDANQAGNAKYLAAPQAQQTIKVGQLTQAITFTSSAPAPGYVAGTYTVAATGGGSGNPVTFTADSASAGVCSVDGAVVSFTGAGNCVIDANQIGNSKYLAAPQAQQTVTVHALSAQVIAFTSKPPNPGFVRGTYDVAATGGGSGNPVTFTADSASAGVCSVDGAVVTFTGAGACVIDANQAGSAHYTAAPEKQQTVKVSAISTQAITFTSTPPSPGYVGSTYTVAATGGGSGNPVTFTADPASSKACTVDGAMVSFTGSGACVIDANQAGSAQFKAAPQAQQAVKVSAQSPQVITFTSQPPDPGFVGDGYTVAATGGGSGNPVTFTADPSSTGCTVDGSAVAFTGTGTCVIDANQAGSTRYLAAPQEQQRIAVEVESGSR